MRQTNTTRETRKKLHLQKLLGLSLIVLCIIGLRLCCTGPMIKDRDGSGAIIVGLIGLTLLFSKKSLLN